MTRTRVSNHRRILCVFARCPDGYGIQHAYKFFRNISSFMVPQGILTIAAYLPREWEVRVVDENVRPLRDADLRWADAVFASGTHVQREYLAEIAARTHEAGKLAVIGGPSVSACTDYYPTFDVLHVGEIGDATDELIAYVDCTVARPERQLVFTTKERLPIEEFPIPAYEHVDFLNYYTATLQFSSGCPYSCDFCDIPQLYGRKPRYKSPERVIAEVEAIVSRNPVGGIYFVDDNFIANKKATKELLPHLIEWQNKNGHRARFGAECTLNVALDRQLLEMMREAYITDVFFGIESPDEDTLRDIDKGQNIQMPILDAVRVINSYGIELSAGMIFGLDNDGPDAAEKILRFIDESNIPFVAPNILTALPKTPLWQRLSAEGRLRPQARVEELNIVYKLGEEAVLAQWRYAIDRAYRPEALYRRFQHQVDHVYPNRKQLPLSRYPITRELLGLLSYTVPSLFLRLGMIGDYRREFWNLTRALLRRGDVGQWIFSTTMGAHFVGFRDDVCSGALRYNIYGPRAASTERRRTLFDLTARRRPLPSSDRRGPTGAEQGALTSARQ
jgi:hopanoid C-2 methylase